MKYPDGQEARLGDKIRVGTKRGQIVCSLDTGEFTHTYGKEEWGFLRYGVLAEIEGMGLVHYNRPDPDIQLIERGLAQ